jgi:hypothetical protein
MSVKVITALAADQLGKFLFKDFRRFLDLLMMNWRSVLVLWHGVRLSASEAATPFTTISSTHC